MQNYELTVRLGQLSLWTSFWNENIRFSDPEGLKNDMKKQHTDNIVIHTTMEEQESPDFPTLRDPCLTDGNSWQIVYNFAR